MRRSLRVKTLHSNTSQFMRAFHLVNRPWYETKCAEYMNNCSKILQLTMYYSHWHTIYSINRTVSELRDLNYSYNWLTDKWSFNRQIIDFETELEHRHWKYLKDMKKPAHTMCDIRYVTYGMWQTRMYSMLHTVCGHSYNSGLNPYPWIFGTITERVFWKKIQNHRWWRHSWDLENKNYMCRYSVS